MTAEQQAAEEVLTAFADPARRRILEVLAGHGPATATAVAARLPASRQAVVKQPGGPGPGGSWSLVGS